MTDIHTAYQHARDIEEQWRNKPGPDLNLMARRFPNASASGGGYHIAPGGGYVAETWEGYFNALAAGGEGAGISIPPELLDPEVMRDAYPEGDARRPVTLPNGSVRRGVFEADNYGSYMTTPAGMGGGMSFGNGGTFSGLPFTPQGGTTEQKDAYATLRAFLDEYGLGSLAEWAWRQLLDGRSPNEIRLGLTERPEYKKRFRAIVERQKLGLSPMSPAEVIAWEQQASQLMRAAGLPPGFYDSFEDFADLIGKHNVSISELNERIQNGYARVANADPLIRQAFSSMFGPSGDAALASVFLDADRALPILEQQVSAAEFAGTGLQFGFRVSKDLAMSAATADLPSYRSRSDWQTAADLNPLFSETVSERNDITPDQGVEAVFGIGGNPTGARENINRRTGQRLADFGGGGGAEMSSAGVKGLGGARR